MNEHFKSQKALRSKLQMKATKEAIYKMKILASPLLGLLEVLLKSN